MKKEIENAQAFYSWDIQKIVSGGKQNSYYIGEDEFKKLLDDEILILER